MQELKSSGSIIAATAASGSGEGEDPETRLVVASGALMTFAMPYASFQGDNPSRVSGASPGHRSVAQRPASGAYLSGHHGLQQGWHRYRLRRRS
jgi:hypothetical protein